MTTQAETLKTEMESFAWSNYETTPDIGIKKLEDIQGIPPDEGIILENKNSSPYWTINNSKIRGGDSFVDVEITMPTTTKRDNIMDDIDAGVLASSYDITYTVTDHPDAYPLFKTKLKVKILV